MLQINVATLKMMYFSMVVEGGNVSFDGPKAYREEGIVIVCLMMGKFVEI